MTLSNTEGSPKGVEMSFTYLLDKLDAAEIRTDPFPHIYLENFLDDNDFEEVVGSPDISVRPAETVDQLFSILEAVSYQPIDFPGCTKSRSEYVAWLDTAVKPKGTHVAW